MNSPEYFESIPKDIDLPESDDLPQKSASEIDRWGEPLIKSSPNSLEREFSENTRWKKLEKVGQGSFSEVWKGYDKKLDKNVALKISKGPSRKILEREAKQLANLSHPNIPEVFEFTTSKDREERVLIMEYVHGKNFLTATIPDKKELLRVSKELASALDYLNKKGIMHADISSLNIIYNPEKPVKLLDFGVSTGVLDRQEINIVPRFPEQRENVHSPSGDVFSLAQMITEKMTNKTYPLMDLKPTSGSYLQDIWKNNLPDAVIPVMEKALSENPNERYETASEFVQDLESSFQNAGLLDT